jgi:signal transduction histidine kinase
VFFHIFFFNAIGPAFSLVLAGFVFYIIWRYEFLDIHTLKDLLDKERIYAHELEMKVRERTQHIEDMLVLKKRLMQDISHAQQTSLTILKADLERLKQSNLGTENKPILDAMEQGIDRASSLMYDLLHAGHLETKPTNTYECVDLSSIARKVVEYVEIVCKAENISLTYTIEPDISIEGDAKQLEELFLTLLSNAVKYRKLSGPGHITLTLTRDAQIIILSIEDTGIGISKEHLPHIFERFYRADRTADNGNGLGLAIAKAITEAHAGTITAQSVLEKGSVFTVRFEA